MVEKFKLFKELFRNDKIWWHVGKLFYMTHIWNRPHRSADGDEKKFKKSENL